MCAIGQGGRHWPYLRFWHYLTQPVLSSISCYLCFPFLSFIHHFPFFNIFLLFSFILFHYSLIFLLSLPLSLPLFVLFMFSFFFYLFPIMSTFFLTSPYLSFFFVSFPPLFSFSFFILFLSLHLIPSILLFSGFTPSFPFSQHPHYIHLSSLYYSTIFLKTLPNIFLPFSLLSILLCIFISLSSSPPSRTKSEPTNCVHYICSL